MFHFLGIGEWDPFLFRTPHLKSGAVAPAPKSHAEASCVPSEMLCGVSKEVLS